MKNDLDFAFNSAVAGESMKSHALTSKFDPTTETFNGITFDDLERYATTIAYKVAANIARGLKMDPEKDPLVLLAEEPKQ